MSKVNAFSLVLIFVLVLFAAIFGIGETILTRVREFSRLDSIVDQQIEAEGLYQGLYHPVGEYKVMMYARRQPEIVILGSSRAMRLRQEFFTRTSYSMGGLVNVPEQAIGLMQRLVALHKPHVVVYSLDHWAFCGIKPSRPDDEMPPRPTKIPSVPGWAASPNRLTFFLRLLSDGRMSSRDAASILNGSLSASRDGAALFGLVAVLRGAGFRTDGAITWLDSQRHSTEPNFAEEQDLIILGGTRFDKGCHLDKRALAYVRMLQEDLDRQGIHLVLIAPPIAAPLVDLMKETLGSDGYVQEWRAALRSRQFSEVHDFHDPRSIGVSSKEFADGIHAGDVAEARAVKAIDESRATALRGMINRSVVDAVVQRYAGFSSIGLRDWNTLSSEQSQR